MPPDHRPLRGGDGELAGGNKIEASFRSVPPAERSGQTGYLMDGVPSVDGRRTSAPWAWLA